METNQLKELLKEVILNYSKNSLKTILVDEVQNTCEAATKFLASLYVEGDVASSLINSSIQELKEEYCLINIPAIDNRLYDKIEQLSDELYACEIGQIDYDLNRAKYTLYTLLVETSHQSDKTSQLVQHSLKYQKKLKDIIVRLETQLTTELDKKELDETKYILDTILTILDDKAKLYEIRELYVDILRLWELNNKYVDCKKSLEKILYSTDTTLSGKLDIMTEILSSIDSIREE